MMIEIGEEKGGTGKKKGDARALLEEGNKYKGEREREREWLNTCQRRGNEGGNVLRPNIFLLSVTNIIHVRIVVTN